MKTHYIYIYIYIYQKILNKLNENNKTKLMKHTMKDTCAITLNPCKGFLIHGGFNTSLLLKLTIQMSAQKDEIDDDG